MRQGSVDQAVLLYEEAISLQPELAHVISFNIELINRRKRSNAADSAGNGEISTECSDNAGMLIEDKFYFDVSTDPLPNVGVKPIAFYLPQFHAIPENDQWWGKGFTEWTNTRKAKPHFKGHHQPRMPTPNLGHYNLENVEVYSKQVELAKSAGIYGFCFHFYWFGGKTLLEKPLKNIISSPEIDFPFCLCWANENWTRRWDGKEDDILISQKHSEDDAKRFLDHVSDYFKDDRYIKVNGRPVLVIYRPKDIPDIKKIQQLWRNQARLHGYPDLYLVFAQTFSQRDPREVGFDAAVQFPPHNHRPNNLAEAMMAEGVLSKDFKGGVYDYETYSALYRADISDEYKTFHCVTLGWDNTARRGNNASIFHNFTLNKYADELRVVCNKTINNIRLADEERFVFINAWNEWGEGTYLEPDTKYGYGYLEATKRALKAIKTSSNIKKKVSVIVPNFNHEKYLPERLQSIIKQEVKPDEIIFLDDASSDNSVKVARRILAASNIKYRIIINKNNSGSVFHQWLKGLDAATGDLIWIAESDDSAHHGFLAEILPVFDNDDVLLAYGDIQYIDVNGQPDSGLTNYYDELYELNHSSSFITSAVKAFKTDFALKNIIPNVSGAVFRRPRLHREERERLLSYRFSGDWYFYSLIARGGSIAYTKEAKSFFRYVKTSASRTAFFTDKHIEEHQMILADLNHIYGLDESVVKQHVRLLSNLTGRSLDEDFSTALNVSKNKIEQTQLRICIASYGFSVGGGEVVPIDIANALRDRGHHITFLCLSSKSDQKGVTLRSRLRPDIPVFYFDDVKTNFANFIEEYSINIVNSHNVGLEYHMYKQNISLNIPYISSLHGGYETVPELLTPEFIKYISTLVSEWFYLAEKNVDVLVTAGLRNARFTKVFNAIVPGRLNVSSSLDIADKLNPQHNRIMFVLASRAIYEKGWQRAIDVITKLRHATNKDCHLILIGDGPSFQEIGKNNASKNYVRFLGRVENPYPIIETCDICIFPSKYSGESFPLFVLECMNAGLAVISTNIGAIPSMLTNESAEQGALLVDHDLDDDSIVEAMANMLKKIISDNNALAMQKNRSKYLSKRFGIENISDLYVSKIREYAG